MKIATKQITNKDAINTSRHLTGLHRWSRSSKTIGFVMLLMEWFAIPFEVVLRREFAQLEWHDVSSFSASPGNWIAHLVGAGQNASHSDLNDREQLALGALLLLL